MPKFNPSVSHTVKDSLTLTFLKDAVVVKGMLTRSPACKRTLALYASVRARGVEHSVPLPFLYKTEQDGPLTKFYMEYVGPDVEKCGMAKSEFAPLKEKSVAELASVGVRPMTISRHLKTWCVCAARGSVIRRAWLIDVGSTCCEPAEPPPQRESP